MRLLKSILYLVLVSCWLVQANAADEPPQRPNFVVFIADDMGWRDIGCYGNPVIQTPSMDALAAGGLRFTQAYLTISSCSPSRASILTGRYPHNTGAPNLHENLDVEQQTTLPELMEEGGYYTVMSGKIHGTGDLREVVDVADDGGLREFNAHSAAKTWTKHVRERPREEPFFFWFASIDPHRGYGGGSETVGATYDAAEVIVPPFLYDGPGTREFLAGYYHEISRFDYYIGQVLEELREQDALDNTVIFVMSDNGLPFPRGKTRLYDSGIKTPFIVHWPERIQPAVTDSLVSSIDVTPTILRLAGLEVPETVQGVSMEPILDDPQATTRDVAFAEQNWHVFFNHSRMVRAGDYLYIRNNAWERLNVARETFEDSVGQELWTRKDTGELTPLQSMIFRKPQPREELFRVGDDPYQGTNLADNPEHQEQLEILRGLLDSWVEQTGDTFPDPHRPDRQEYPGMTDVPDQDVDYEVPGESAGATEINEPGPIVLQEEVLEKLR